MIGNLLLAATAVFVQAQLKYGAERDDFLHRWYERPLHQNSVWKSNGKDFLNAQAWQLTAKTLREGGFDGVAFFSSSLDARRDVVLKRSLEPGGETGVLFELAGYGGFENCVTAAGRALRQPNAYRIGGKTVLPLRGDKSVVFTNRYQTFSVKLPAGSLRTGENVLGFTNLMLPTQTGYYVPLDCVRLINRNVPQGMAVIFR